MPPPLPLAVGWPGFPPLVRGRRAAEAVAAARLLPPPSLRLVLANFVSLLYLSLQLSVRPYKRDDDNALGGLAALSLCASFMCAAIKTPPHTPVPSRPPHTRSQHCPLHTPPLTLRRCALYIKIADELDASLAILGTETSDGFAVLVGGILPFGACFVELFFILNSDLSNSM